MSCLKLKKVAILQDRVFLLEESNDLRTLNKTNDYDLAIPLLFYK